MTKDSPGDEIYAINIALFCYHSCVFNAPKEAFPWDDLRRILPGGQRMAKIQSGEEILPEVSTPD